MKWSVTQKLLLGYLIFSLLSILFIATVSSTMTLRRLEGTEAKILYDSVNDLASDLRQVYQGGNSATSFDTLKGYAKALNASAWLVMPDGQIIFDSAGIATDMRIVGFDATLGGENYYTIGDYYGFFEGEEVLTVSAPIVGGYTVSGYLVLHFPVSLLNSTRDALLDVQYLTFFAMLFLSLLIILLVRLIVIKPLDKINRAAMEYAQGNLTYALEVKSRDELGDLADTLNYMAGELKNSEEYQRKFVSNVSHDFRSPLTSIKGYLEAMLDGTIPPELQPKYMNIVIRETERLTELTRNTLKLQSLQSRTMALEITDFDINDMIRTTAASFEGTCTSRNIMLDLIFHEESRLVRADKTKIQQVLYNLLDNAIKFSNDDSSITIEAAPRHGKVFVSVKDTGIGIPRDSLKKIWTRFYKTDDSRGKDKKGTGLGLSIVREIITAHGENIDVISTEGVGTEFVFSLPSI